MDEKKNCINCDMLQYFDGDYDQPQAGFYCEGRNYFSFKEEQRHLKQLDDAIYRARSKRCFKKSVPSKFLLGQQGLIP